MTSVATVMTGCTDHVVGVAGHVDVGVVAGVGLVLDVRDVDGDAARGLLGARSMRSNGTKVPVPRPARTLVMAAVSVVLPWST